MTGEQSFPQALAKQQVESQNLESASRAWGRGTSLAIGNNNENAKDRVNSGRPDVGRLDNERIKATSRMSGPTVNGVESVPEGARDFFLARA